MPIDPKSVQWDDQDSSGIVWDDKAHPDFVREVMKAESNFSKRAVSPKGAVGDMQTMPSTLLDPGYGVRPARDDSDAERTRVGIDYLNAMLRKYNWNPELALRAYNAGPGNTDNGVYPAETKTYVKKILKGSSPSPKSNIIWDDEKSSNIIWDDEPLPKDYLLANKPTEDYAKTIARGVAPSFDRTSPPGQFTDEETARAIEMPPLRSGKEMLQDARAGGEAALQTITGLAAMPVAGLAGTVMSAGWLYPEVGADTVEKVSNALTYKPTTQRGEEVSKVVNKPLELMDQGSDYVGGKVAEVTGQPELGALTKTTLMMVIPSILGKGMSVSFRGVTSQLKDTASRRAFVDAVREEAKATGTTPDQVVEKYTTDILKGFEEETPPSRVVKSPEMTETAEKVAADGGIPVSEAQNPIQSPEMASGDVLSSDMTNRPMGTEKVAPEVTQKTILEVKGDTPHKTALKLEAESVARDLIDKSGFADTETGIAMYEKEVGMMKSQAEKAVAIMDADFPTAVKMVFGEAPLPEGVYHATMLKAVSNRAKAMGDVDLIQKLGTDHRAYAPVQEAAKGLKAADVTDPNDPVQAIRDVANARGETAKKTGAKSTADLGKLEQDVAAKQEALDNHLLSTAAEKKPSSRPAGRYGSKNKIVTEDSYLKAKAELRSQLSTMSAGVDPTLIANLGKIGVYHLEAGIRTFNVWSKAMVKDAGDWVKPHLDDLWKNSRDIFSKATIDNIAGKITKAVEEGRLPDVGRYAQKIAQHFVEQGITDRQGLVKAVHNVLKEVIPDITPRETMDAISGYGKYKQLSKDDISIKLRDLKGQMQQVAKLEDLRRKGTAEKTGVERRIPSDEERRLIKLVEEAKRKFGIQTVDKATQLKSALDAVKTRLTNQIADLETQLKTRQKIVQERTNIPLDQAAEKLKARRDELKRQFDEMFADPKKTPSEKYDIAQKKRLQRQIEELEKQIQKREKTERPRMSTAIDKETYDLQMRRDAAKKQFDDIFKTGISDEQRIAMATKAVKKSIEEYTRRIKENDLSAMKRGREPVRSEDLDALREMRDKLKEQYGELKDAAKPKRSPEEIALQRVKTRMRNEAEKLKDQLRDLKFDEKQKGSVTLDAEGRKLKSELDRAKTAQKAAAEAKGTVTKEEAAQILELSKKVSEAEAAMEAGGNRFEYGASRVAFENFLKDLKGENASVVKLVGNKMKELRQIGKENPALAVYEGFRSSLKTVVDNSIAMVATLDNSFLGRQGLHTLQTHPTVWARAAVNSFADFARTIGGKQAHDALMADIYSRENFRNGSYEKAKILPKSEEQFPTSIPERIPGVGRVFKASESAFTGSAIRMRTGLYDLLSDMAKKNGINVMDAKFQTSLGKMINSLTARGQWGKTGEPPVIRLFMWAPKMLKANIDVLTAHGGGLGLEHSFARKQARINVVKIVAETATVMAIADALMPGSVEWDPRSADFGKIKIGRTRFDITGGASSMITLAARIVTNSTKSSTTGLVTPYGTGFGEGSRRDAAIAFLENKSTPPARVLIDWFKGRDYEGKPFSLAKSAYRATVPISIQQGVQLKENGYTPDAVAGVMADIFGVSANTYKPDTDKKLVPVAQRPARERQIQIKHLRSEFVRIQKDPTASKEDKQAALTRFREKMRDLQR